MQYYFIENEGKSTDYSEFFMCLNHFARDCHLGTSPSPISNVICSADSDIHGTQTADIMTTTKTLDRVRLVSNQKSDFLKHRIIQTKTKNEKQLKFTFMLNSST